MSADALAGAPAASSLARVARGWAALDLAATSLLVWPPLAQAFIGVMHTLSGAEAPESVAVERFFVTLAGILGVLWAIVRLRDPRRDLVLGDAIARVFVALAILWFIGAEGAPLALLAFVASELGGAVHQAIALRR